MSNREISPTAKTLISAKAFIDTEDKWVRGVRIAYNTGGVVTRCALGALDAALGSALWASSRSVEVKVLAESARELWPGNPGDYGDESAIATYNNDHPDGHKAVMKLFDHAIQKELNKVPELCM